MTDPAPDCREPLVRHEVSDGVLKIELLRPDARNAINLGLARELLAAVRRGLSDDVRSILLVAAGAHFSVGGDLRDFVTAEEGRSARVSAIADALHEAVLTLAQAPVPTVAAVQGWCAGAGVGLACGADIVVAGFTARFRSAYTAVALTPDLGLTWLLPRLVGDVRAADLILTNRVIEAPEAANWGLISRAVPDGDLRVHAEAIANDLALGPREAHGDVRRLLRANQIEELRVALDHEREMISRRVGSAEGQEGVAAFLEHRTPNYLDLPGLDPGANDGRAM